VLEWHLSRHCFCAVISFETTLQFLLCWELETSSLNKLKLLKGRRIFHRHNMMADEFIFIKLWVHKNYRWQMKHPATLSKSLFTKQYSRYYKTPKWLMRFAALWKSLSKKYGIFFPELKFWWFLCQQTCPWRLNFELLTRIFFPILFSPENNAQAL
jgi:hypothetical protein